MKTGTSLGKSVAVKPSALGDQLLFPTGMWNFSSVPVEVTTAILHRVVAEFTLLSLIHRQLLDGTVVEKLSHSHAQHDSYTDPPAWGRIHNLMNVITNEK